MHTIKYVNSESYWNDALPLGNGHFGAMGFYNDAALTLAMNHYDVYYKKMRRYSEAYRNGEITRTVRARPAAEVAAEAMAAHLDPHHVAHHNYDYVLSPNQASWYGAERGGASLCPTGEVRLRLDPQRFRRPDKFELMLNMEQAALTFSANAADEHIAIDTIVSEGSDFMISTIRQSSPLLFDTLELEVPQRRKLDMSTEYHALNRTTFYYISSFYPDGENREKYGPFRFIVMVRLFGAEGEAVRTDGLLQLKLVNSGTTVTILTHVVTQEETKDLLAVAQNNMTAALANIDGIRDLHQEYWDAFWNKSSLSLSDKFVEQLWYVNLYALACASGRGARLYEQACGLNGLWDVRQPTQWGSTWYWDVNIQQAFWPIYTSNHTELGEAFYRGLYSYIEEAKLQARTLYNLDGIAADFPHPPYLSIWPWCAQYFWWHYKYTGDIDFLRNEAYPLFQGLLKFIAGYLQYDAERDEYVIFPDVSPEQGPVTQNSTITVSAWKYLLEVGIEANRILGASSEERAVWENILAKFPKYATAETIKYGRIIKDSEWAPADQHLGHASLLMPVYPIGELSKRSPAQIREMSVNTLKYAIDEIAKGTHGFGWLAAAAARLGMGDIAAHLLYEDGIAFMMRHNGLFSEETERWMQNTLTAVDPVYNPPLMEAGGAFVSAVGEMLLHSFGGIIEVFPAVPDGSYAIPRKKNPYGLMPLDRTEPAVWRDCEFRGFLAEGGFEVSASYKDGRTKWVTIRSLLGSELKFINPWPGQTCAIMCGGKEADCREREGVVSLATSPGGEYVISPAGYAQVEASAEPAEIPPLAWRAMTNRRVYLGLDADADFVRQLDDFTFDYYSGNQQVSRIGKYRLDFTTADPDANKDYLAVLPQMYHGSGKIALNFRRITANTEFSVAQGWGWRNSDGLAYIDRGGPDALRRDFISGAKETELVLELGRGRYDLLFIIGDTKAPTLTRLLIQNQIVYAPETALRPGQFAYEVIPILQKTDGYVSIKLSSDQGCDWKLNALIVNSVV